MDGTILLPGFLTLIMRVLLKEEGIGNDVTNIIYGHRR